MLLSPVLDEVVRDLDNPEYTIPFGRNSYCGPAALAYLLRTDPDSAALILREVSGRAAIRGTARAYMLAALNLYGLGFIERPHMNLGRCRTLAQWLEIERPAADAEYLVIVTGHYIVVHGDRWFDSRCHLGKPMSRSPHLRKLVRSAWRIKKRAG